MTQIMIIENSRVDGEKEALEILNDIESSLQVTEQILFFFFFVNNGVIFHDKNNEFFLQNQLLKNRIDFENIVDLDISTIDLDVVDNKIYDIWVRYIENNSGKCASYFGEIARNLIKSFLEKTSQYHQLNREAKIHNRHNPIHEDPIDLIGHSDSDCDLFECKHTIRSQSKKTSEQLDNLCDIVGDLKTLQLLSRRVLATIEFINKNIVCDLINDYDNNIKINNSDVINGEDVFGVNMRS